MNRHSIRKKLWVLGSLYTWFTEIIKIRSNLPINKKLYYLARGFDLLYCSVYDFDKFGIENYLDERRRLTRVGLINYGYEDVFCNKVIFNELISKYVRTPKLYCHFRKGRVIELCRSGIDTYEKLLLFIQQAGDQGLIFKPIDDHKGAGIFVVAFSPQHGYRYNTDVILENDLIAKLKNVDEFYVTEFVDQGSFGKQIFKDTVNTVRILTMIDPETSKAFIAGAFFRFGNWNSYPVDNVAQGGIFSTMDANTGKFLASYIRQGNVFQRIEKHPETEANLEGIIVPDWDKIVASVLDLANSVNYLKHVGWDIVALDGGDIMIIEGNLNSDVYLIQAAAPLLLDDRVKKFYQYYGAVKKK